MDKDQKILWLSVAGVVLAAVGLLVPIYACSRRGGPQSASKATKADVNNRNICYRIVDKNGNRLTGVELTPPLGPPFVADPQGRFLIPQSHIGERVDVSDGSRVLHTFAVQYKGPECQQIAVRNAQHD